jgi:hypothetical protein
MKYKFAGDREMRGPSRRLKESSLDGTEQRIAVELMMIDHLKFKAVTPNISLGAANSFCV